MSDGHGSAPGEYRGGRQKGTKNKATIERENMISRAIGELSRPLGEDVLAECMVEFREMAISVTDFRLKDRPFAYPPVSAASRPQRGLRGPQGPPPLRPTKHNAPQARGISSSPWQAFPGRGGGLSPQLLARPGQCDPARRSQRRMIGLTDGHPSFVLQAPSPRPSR